jgi:hypothetical protein
MRKRFIKLLKPIILSTTSAHVSAEPIFGNLGEPAWSRMYKYFENRFGVIAKDEIVLIPAVAPNAAWDDQNKYVRLLEMYGWGDRMPSMAWQYSRNASMRISEGYGYFLATAFNAAVAANGTMSTTLKQAVTRSSEELEFSRADYNKTVADADKAYTDYAAVTPISKRRSKATYFSIQGWDAQIGAKRKRLEQAQSTYATVSSSLVDPDIQMLSQARLKYDNPNEQISLPPVPEVLNDPNLWSRHYTSFIDGKISDFLTEYTPESQSIDEAQSTSDYFEMRWKASVNAKFLGVFRVAGASAEQVRREQHIQNNTTRIDIDFANVKTFNITRGDWYSENLISLFHNKLGQQEFTNVFGPNGQLELIPKTILVGRGMKFTIHADSNTLDYLYEHFKGGADSGIRVGWFTIGGKGEYSHQRADQNYQIGRPNRFRGSERAR